MLAQAFSFGSKRALSSRHCVSKPTSFSGHKRRYCGSKSNPKDESGSGESGKAGDETTKSRPGLPAKFRVKNPVQAHNRSGMSILSPLNRVALELGEDAVILFAGAYSTGDRFSSWPSQNSCRLVPEGTSPPAELGATFTGNVTADLSNLYSEVARTVKGLPPKTTLTNIPSGKVNWLVGVGDPIEPLQEFLQVGPFKFIHQPPFKHGPTPTLYAANFCIPEDARIYHALPPGTPLVVAVYDPAHIPRFEAFLPTANTLKRLKELPKTGRSPKAIAPK